MQDCDRHGFFIGKTRNVSEFSGSSPPEVFVGRWNYPNVYAGILSPTEHGDTALLSSPELWHAKKLSINEITKGRNSLIYGRSKTSVKAPSNQFLRVLREVAMTHQSIATEFHLQKPIGRQEEQAANSPLIAHAAELKHVRLLENAPVKPRVDYLVSDTAVKATQAINELNASGIATSSISKLLSAGLLGQGKMRKLVPTRWSITAVDDTISKRYLEKITSYPELNEIAVFNAAYLGNHYEFLLLPGRWEFEVIERSLKTGGVWRDHERFYGRKKYATDVTGAYYANRLAVCEYLHRIRRQATVLVLREIHPSYSAPLGVGILRETSRAAFAQIGTKFATLTEAFDFIQTRIRTPIDAFTSISEILREYGKQLRISDFILRKNTATARVRGERKEQSK